jgi:hypothetical protein
MCLFPIKGPIKGKIITMIKYYIYKAEYKKLGYTFDYNRNMIVCDVTAVCIFFFIIIIFAC